MPPQTGHHAATRGYTSTSQLQENVSGIRTLEGRREKGTSVVSARHSPQRPTEQANEAQEAQYAEIKEPYRLQEPGHWEEEIGAKREHCAFLYRMPLLKVRRWVRGLGSVALSGGLDMRTGGRMRLDASCMRGLFPFCLLKVD